MEKEVIQQKGDNYIKNTELKRNNSTSDINQENSNRKKWIIFRVDSNF